MVALLLSVFPLVYTARWLRPEFVTIFVIYWVIFSPQQTSLMLIFWVGCLQDLLEASLLGQHALALLTVAYLSLLLGQRFKHYLVWQQSVVVFLLVMAHQLVDNWVHSMQGASAVSLEFLMPAFTSALFWPLIWMFLEKARANFRVT
jgi:rod shape-determining protein MreD